MKLDEEFRYTRRLHFHLVENFYHQSFPRTWRNRVTRPSPIKPSIKYQIKSSILSLFIDNFLSLFDEIFIIFYVTFYFSINLIKNYENLFFFQFIKKEKRNEKSAIKRGWWVKKWKERRDGENFLLAKDFTCLSLIWFGFFRLIKRKIATFFGRIWFLGKFVTGI